MSLAPAQNPTAKICVVCGLDVSQQKRTKDSRGNYYCVPCWSLKIERQRQAQAATASKPVPTIGEPDLLFCEGCSGRFTADNLQDFNGQILCTDCITALSALPKPKAMSRPGEVPAHVREIVATNSLILIAFVCGFIFPLSLVTAWVARRLLNALGVAKQARWLVGCGIPLIGLLVFKRIIDMAAREVDAHRPSTDPLTAIEREQYGRLILLGRIGWVIALCGTVVLFFLTGRWGWDNLFGLVGLGVMATAAIKRMPYHRKLRNSGYVKLWFATSNPIEDYATKIGGK